MTTYMTWETAGGKKGRCDAKCHNARGQKCRCMCRGNLHGSAIGKTPEEARRLRDEKAPDIFAMMNDARDIGEINNWILRAEQRQLPLQEVKEK